MAWLGQIATQEPQIICTELRMATAFFVACGEWGTILTSADGITWTSRHSGGVYDYLYRAIYTNGTFVVVGAQIFTSANGTSWIQRNSGTGHSLLGLSYGNGTFLCVGESVTILTSGFGITW